MNLEEVQPISFNPYKTYLKPRMYYRTLKDNNTTDRKSAICYILWSQIYQISFQKTKKIKFSQNFTLIISKTMAVDTILK